jgi:Planctomycete cytochrome C
MEWNLQIMNGGASRRTCALPIEYKRQDPPPAPSQTRGISPMRIDRAVFDSGPNARASVLIGLMLLRGSAPRAGLADEPDSRAAVDFFEKSVRPVLSASCQKCHGPRKQSSELRLDSREAILTGGSAGPAIVPGKPDESLLVQAVAHSHDELKMPPKGKLPAPAVAALRRWIEMGVP